jgi:Tol biopolymer transport system component
MVSWDGRQRLALTAAADGTGKPRWSSDGRYVSYMAKPAGAKLGVAARSAADKSNTLRDMWPPQRL